MVQPDSETRPGSLSPSQFGVAYVETLACHGGPLEYFLGVHLGRLTPSFGLALTDAY